MRIALVGLGATGSHIARQVVQSPFDVIDLYDPDNKAETRTLSALRAISSDGFRANRRRVDPIDPPDVVVLASPSGTHADLARQMLQAGSHVVSLADDPDEVGALLELHEVAVREHRSLVVGAGFSPGLSCLLVRYAADQLDEVDAVRTYKAGTGGPACARRHHKSLQRPAHDWVDGEWMLRNGGSGRELAWFPDPFGARDCYRGALSEPLLVQRSYPEAARISARLAANRRDRLTSWLPMLTPPHADGGPGAIRVEVRGRRNGEVQTKILGVMDHPSVAAAIVATEVAIGVAQGVAPVGAQGLAAWDHYSELLVAMRKRGVRVALYQGFLDVGANP